MKVGGTGHQNEKRTSNRNALKIHHDCSSARPEHSHSHSFILGEPQAVLWEELSCTNQTQAFCNTI